MTMPDWDCVQGPGSDYGMSDPDVGHHDPAGHLGGQAFGSLRGRLEHPDAARWSGLRLALYLRWARHAMPCTHRLPTRWAPCGVGVGPYGGTELQLVEEGGESTQEDVSVGAFRCTQCGEVGYYTDSWREYYENGVPCSGSDRVSRQLPRFKPTR
jgi:hypothetical protein